MYVSVNNLRNKPTRPLSTSEINALITNNCRLLSTTSSWSSIHIFQSSSFTPSTIINVVFGGTCIIGSYTSTLNIDGIELPTGLYDTTIIDSILSDNVRVSQTLLLSRCILDQNAAVVGCGKICMKAKTSAFGNGQSIGIAIETGGREVMICADMTLEIAAAVSGDRSPGNVTTKIQSWERHVVSFTNSITSDKSLIASRAVLFNCPCIEDVYIGPGAYIDNSTVINSSILSSNDDIEDPNAKTKIIGGCHISNSIIQYGCTCESMAIVEGSFMCSTSHVDKHAKLLDSILGPCSGVSEGEITASLVGPFVGFHHQSLLIACYWPSGRGNIGYGANVGSNHTGKAPDQEIWPGEGLFFGLATAIKFPSNFVKSPYTLIATGVTTLPQRLEMPFSLINSSGEVIKGLSPALNEISPGWILSDNLYMILRNETKFLKRGAKVQQMSNKTGYIQYENEALRPTTINMILEARQRLLNVDAKQCEYTDGNGNGIWTSKEISGLGKNYMKEMTRIKSISTYNDFVLYYCIRTLWRAIQENEMEKRNQNSETKTNSSSSDGENSGMGNGGMGNDVLNGDECIVSAVGVQVMNGSLDKKMLLLGDIDITSTLTIKEKGGTAQNEWYGYAKRILQHEMQHTNISFNNKITMVNAKVKWEVKDLLLKYIEMVNTFATNVLVSKQKDDKRGPKIIDGYSDAHGKAKTNDAVVRKAREDADKERRDILTYLETYGNRSSRL